MIPAPKYTSPVAQPEYFPATEFFTPAEVARKLKCHQKTVLRRFRDLNGVLNVGVGKREMIRIPGHVLNRHIEQNSRGFVLKSRRRAV